MSEARMCDGKLVLRTVRTTDHDLCTAWLSDPNLAFWHGNPDPEHEFERMLRATYNFIVEADTRPVGTVGLEGDWDHGISAELAILIDPAVQRRGYGSHAVTLALDFAFTSARLHRVWHGVVSDQPAVMSFFRALGFVEEGRAREARFADGQWADHVYYSLLEDEWRTRRMSGSP